MSMYLVMAFRNLWRNTHRTLITTASVFFAVVLVLFTRSMQRGTYEHVIRTSLRTSTGFLQVQAPEFRDKRSLENSMELDESLIKKALAIKHVTHAVPRIESFALASTGEDSRGVMITAIAPRSEDRMNNLSERITDGRFLESGDRGVLAGAKLAEYLSLKVNDSLVLISQGYHGASAAGIYPVIGVVDLPVPDLNANVVYMPLEEAQWFFAMPGRVTSLAVMIDDADKLGEVKAEAGNVFSGDYVVLDWEEMLPELVQFIQVDNAGGVIMLGILYLVIGFGIFGTVMMMSAERKREFAVLISIGMKKWRLNLMVFLETVIIGLMGSIAGMLFSIPLLLYMKGHPIKLTGDVAEVMIRYGFEPLIPFLVEPSIFINQTMTVLAISILASLYPLWSTEKIKVSDVLRA